MTAPSLWPCTRCGRYLVQGGPCSRCRRVERWTNAVERIGVPPRFAEAAFGATDLLASRVARHAAIAEALASIAASSVVLTGPTGSGKTTAGVSMLHGGLAENFDRAPTLTYRFASAIALAMARADAPLGTEPRAIRDAVEAGVLLLDDLGSEPARFVDVIAEIVMRRHDADRPLWCTTWLSGREIAARYGGGVARRLLERAHVIRCGGAS